jgi:hypothetical protein
MNNPETLTVFFGWCTAINFALLIISTIMLVLMKDFVSGVHSKMFGVDKSELPATYIQYLGYYKIGIIIFNLVPYLALKMMY